MSARPKIAIVDEQPIFRIGLTQVLNKDSKYEVLAEGDSKADAIRITSELEPDVLLLDAELEGAGIETLRSLTEKSNRTRTIMLTKTESEHDMNASFQAGARGYVRKDIRAPCPQGKCKDSMVAPTGRFAIMKTLFCTPHLFLETIT